MFGLFDRSSRTSKTERREKLALFAEEITRKHVKTLRAQISQGISFDPYGNTNDTKATGNLVYFLTHVVISEFAKSEHKNVSEYAGDTELLGAAYFKMLEVLKDDMLHDTLPDIKDVHTGIEYEFFCKAILDSNGWIVTTTPITGDQGADLIATGFGCRVVLQCKFYSQPVGNKAVQEVYAAKGFQRADYAVAVSNAAFTDSAKQLASTNGVFLLHHYELADLRKRLGV